MSKIGIILTIILLYNSSEYISSLILYMQQRHHKFHQGFDIGGSITLLGSYICEIITFRLRPPPCFLIGLHARACPWARILCFSVWIFNDAITTIIVERENNSHLWWIRRDSNVIISSYVLRCIYKYIVRTIIIFTIIIYKSV